MDIDSIKSLGTKQINQEEYEEMKRKCKATFPYVFNERWIGQLSKVDDNYSLTVFATGMRITAKLVDTDTGITTLRLQYFDGIAEVQRDFDSSILTKLGIKELYRYGIRFAEDDAYKVVKYLVKSEGNAPIIRSYSKLSWSKDGNVKLFRAHHAFCADGVYKELTYNGKLDLTPTGDLNKWLAMVKSEVLQSTAMTVVLLIGFAGSLVSLLNEKKDIGSLMFNLSNRSSKGKTTAAMLASSVFSNPVLNRGTVITFNATENALVQFISGCGGHTVVLDEVALSHSKEFNRLMYSICNGRSKMRLNGDASQKEVAEFNGIVLSTAEFSLISEDTPNGIKARVFEIKDVLTTSAENSDSIKSCIYENHALAGEYFVRYLLQKGDEVFDDYEQDKKYLCDKCVEKKELSERILSKLATILTTARYVNIIFALGINEDEIVEYILNLERQVTTDLKPEERLLEIVRQEVVRNNSRFITDGYTPSSCWGAIKVKGGQTEVQIIEPIFEKIMIEDYKIFDYKVVLKKLKNDGLLLSEPDRLFKRVTLMKEVGRQKCYCFVLNNSVHEHSTKPPQRDIEAEMGDVDIFAEMTNAMIDD